MELSMNDKEKATLKVLVDLAEQEIDRGSLTSGEWPELEEALDLFGPIVYPDTPWKPYVGRE